MLSFLTFLKTLLSVELLYKFNITQLCYQRHIHELMTVCDNLHVNHSHDRWWYMIYTHILQCSVIYCAHFYREFYLNTRLPGALHSIWSVTTFNRLNSNEKNMANKLHGVWTYFSCIRFALVLNAYVIWSHVMSEIKYIKIKFFRLIRHPVVHTRIRVVLPVMMP